MKKIFKIVALFAIVINVLLLSACMLTENTQLQFSELPKAEYVVNDMQEDVFLESVKVKVDGKEHSLAEMKKLGAVVTGVNLNTVGTYTLMVNYQGATIIFEYKVVSADEVELNGTAYATFLEAFAELSSVEGKATFKLLKDVKVEPNKITIANTADVKLDLNGFSLYCVSEIKSSNSLVNNKGSLEIVGTSGSISYLSKYPDVDWGTIGYPSYACNAISNNGTLVVNGDITIENQTPRGGASYAIDNYAGSTLLVKKGTIKQSGGDIAIRMFNGSNSSINVTIDGGHIVGCRAIWLHLASNKAEVSPEMNLTINGGVLEATIDNQPVIYSYSYGNSFAKVNIVINGGEFNGSSIQLCGGYKGDNHGITINGGKFEFDVIRWLDGDNYEVLYKANK